MDSNHPGDLNEYRSLAGYVFTLVDGVVSEMVSLQNHIALSLNEA